MNIRSLIVSLGVIVGLTSCGSEPATSNVSTITVPQTVVAPQETDGNVVFNLVGQVTASAGVSPQYTWYLGDDAGTTVVTDMPYLDYDYTENGEYSVVVIVSDTNNTASDQTIRITVTVDSIEDEASLSADFLVSSNAFELSFTSQVANAEAQVTYLWDFGDSNTSTQANPVHTFASPISYIVSLTVTDSLGNTDTIQKSVRVSATANKAPMAVISTPTTNFLEVDVSGALSSDPEGSVLSYEWDFGDGTVVSDGVFSQLHSYQVAGTYTIKLTVSDGELSASTLQSVTVVADPNANAPYYSLLETAYDNFLNPIPNEDNPPEANCANCHYDENARVDSAFSLGTNGMLITLNTAEQGLVDLIESGSEKLTANPIDGENNHIIKISGDNASTWTDLLDAMTLYLDATSNTNPVANITTPVVDGLTVTLNATGSSDIDGDALNYAWTFGAGEGSASGETATYTFSTAGNKTITLMVTDGKGGFDSQSTTVTVVKPKEAPTAAFEFTSNMLTASFDASASVDADGDTIFYAWDFGDGNTAAASTQASTAHTYAAEGTFDVTLTVSDVDGEMTLTKSVEVSLQANTAPVAVFTPVANGLSVTLNASGSTDAEGDDLTYQWVINNMVVSEQVLDSHVFASSGEKSIELIVRDSKGASNSTIQTIVLGNQAPTANFSIQTSEGTVTVDGGVSTDPEDDALTYAWDFGDASSDTGESASNTYSESGTYTITLTVNDGGNSAQFSRDVTVEVIGNYAPRARFTATRNEINTDEYSFDATATTDAENDPLTYSWDFGDGASAIGVTTSHEFATDADYRVTLTVSDGNSEDVYFQNVTTTAALVGDVINGESLYASQCANCHEGEDDSVYGEGDPGRAGTEIAINSYLDHQLDLFERIETTMPTGDPATCAGQCAADIEAFMMTWERVIVDTQCTQTDADAINYGPRQMRLLTSQEYVNTVKTLFGYDVDLGLLPADDQIHFFSNHAKTPLNSARLDAFESLAKKIVAYSASQNYTNVAGFDEGFVDGVARRAFRRPLNGVEKAGYAALEATDINDAMQALLISPYFLFRSELGMSKDEFIDFNENADPVYKFVGEPQIITDMRVNGGVVADGKLEIYQTGDITMNLTGRDLIIIRARGESTAGANSEWPLIKPMFDNTDVAGYTNLRAESESFKNYSILVEGKTGQHTFKISNNDQGNHPQAAPYSRHAWIESVTVAAAEQVIFEVPDIEEGSYALTPYEIATFIAYTYTGNTPDDVLLDAANQGFPDDASIRTQIERLMATDAAKEHFGTFVDQWLMTDGVLSAAKDDALFPTFTQEVREAMHQEAREIFNDVIFNETGFTNLFDSNYTFVNNVLADFYGTGGASGAAFEQVSDATRGGLLTTGAFLASQATPEESHLIKRAVRVRERVMCQHLPPFPTDVDLDSIRELQAQKVEDAKEDNGAIRQPHLDFINTDIDACKGCHEYIINPLGVAMEDYDAVGLPRTTYASNGLSVDFTGFDSTIEAHNAHLYGVNDLYETTDGVALSGAKSLGQVLADEQVTRDCLQEMAFRFVMDTGPDQFDHADKTKIVLADEELVNYACAMDSMNDAMSAQDNPREAFINIGLSEVVRFRKEYNR